MRKPPLDCSGTIYQTVDESAFAPSVDVERVYKEIVALYPALESLSVEQLGKGGYPT